MPITDTYFDCNLVPFDAVRLKSARTIWVSKDYLRDHDGAGDPKAAFAARFAYAVPGGPTFEKLSFDLDDTAVMMAERYGGGGIDHNGGGARCGNIGNFQVKGNGRNLLAGAETELHHSYGAFRAVYAIHEAIYTAILQRIMPLGAAPIHGVMLTGSDAAYEKTTVRGWGGMMVREYVSRPASLLRAGFFTVPDEHKPRMYSDAGRVKLVCRQLMRRVGVNGFIELLGMFLMNSANQFAFARLARITHGAVTSSNLSFDGRWLDLTNTSFLCSADNIIGGNTVTPSFYEEMHAPVDIMREMASTFGKHNGVDLNVAPLVNYYRERLASYLDYHAGYVFGFRYEEVPDALRSALLPRLSAALSGILSSGTPVLNTWPRDMDENDPILCLVECLFCRAFDVAPTVQAQRFAQLRPAAVEPAWAAFSAIAPAVFIETGAGMSRRALLQAFIVAYQRSALPEFFYKERMEAAIIARLDHADPLAIDGYVAGVMDLLEWAFPTGRHARNVLFSSDRMSIEFDTDSLTLGVTLDRETWTVAPGRMLSLLSTVPAQAFAYLEYDFRAYLERLLGTLDSMASKVAS